MLEEGGANSAPSGSAVIDRGLVDEMLSEVTVRIRGLWYPVFEEILSVVAFTVPPEAELLEAITEFVDVAVLCEDGVTEEDWTIVLELEESWVSEVLWDPEEVEFVDVVEFCPDTRDGGRRNPTRSKCRKPV